MYIQAFHPHQDYPVGMEIKNCQSNINNKSSCIVTSTVTCSVLTGSPSAPGGPWRQVFPADPSLQPTDSLADPGGPGGPGAPGSPFVPWLPKPALPWRRWTLKVSAIQHKRVSSSVILKVKFV